MRRVQIFMLIVVGVLLCVAFIIRSPLLKKSIVQTTNPDIQQVLTHIEDIFNKHSKKYDAKTSFTSDSSLWWDTEDNYSIINRNSLSVVLSASCAPKSQIEAITPDLSPKIKAQFLSDGFFVNQKNTSTSYSDNSFYDYVEAFEKGNTVCTYTVNPDCYSVTDAVDGPYANNIEVTCTDQLDTNRAVQEPLLKSFGITGSIVEIRKKSGDFADISVNGRRAGYHIIAKQVDGKWKKLVEGQETPLCSDVNRYKIPSAIVESCYQNDKLVTNTN